MLDTIPYLIKQENDAADAIGALGREALSYSELSSLIERTVSALNRLGVGRNDAVAIVLPNGPEIASSFVAIAGGATTAPLNPNYREEEYEFYLSDLQTKLLVVEARGWNTG